MTERRENYEKYGERKTMWSIQLSMHSVFLLSRSDTTKMTIIPIYNAHDWIFFPRKGFLNYCQLKFFLQPILNWDCLN